MIEIIITKELKMEQNGIPASTDTIDELKAKLAEVEKERDNALKRMKDTQASYTKGQQKNKELEAQLKVYQDQLTISAGLDTPEMEELKMTNPEEWYNRRRNMELEAQKSFKDKLDKASLEAIQAQTKADNEALLRDFKERNPQITDELINDVPYRIHSKLQKGEISFGDFLNEVEDYYNTGRVVGGQSQAVLDGADLGNMSNASGVTNQKLDYDSFVSNYKNSVI